MAAPKQKFSAQADPELLKAVRQLAHKEGRQLHSIIDEALRDLIDKRNRVHPRSHVLSYYKASLEKYGPLYERLAK